MKIAVVRGDFINPWELQNFELLSRKNDVVLFTGKRPISLPSKIFEDKTRSLFSPVDINFGKISRIRMAVINRLFTDAHVLFGLEKELSGFDIVHCAETYYSFTQQSIRAKLQNKVSAVISTVWETIPFNNEGIFGRKQYKQISFLHVDKFLAVTDRAKKALIKEGCSGDKIKIIHPGVNLRHFYKVYGKKILGLENNRTRKLLFVGRLEPEKGIRKFLNDHGHVLYGHANTELIIVGSGSERNDIENIVKNKYPGRVRLLGNVNYNDMPTIYSLCDILIHPVVGTKTWEEQYGMVLIEAMACGLPIIATDNGAIPEVIGGAGITTEWNKLAVEVNKLLSNQKLRQELSKKALSRTKEKYNSDRYSLELEKTYEKVLAKNKA